MLADAGLSTQGPHVLVGWRCSGSGFGRGGGRAVHTSAPGATASLWSRDTITSSSIQVGESGSQGLNAGSPTLREPGKHP